MGKSQSSNNYNLNQVADGSTVRAHATVDRKQGRCGVFSVPALLSIIKKFNLKLKLTHTILTVESEVIKIIVFFC